MPKMKTHRSAMKRYRVTATGKIMRGQAGRSHLNVKKASNRKAHLDTVVQVDDTNLAKIKLELPYMKYARR